MTDPIIAAARFLGGHLDWLRHRSATEIQESFADIAAAARVVASLARGPQESKYLGPCGAEIEEEVEDDFDFTMIMTHTRTCDGDVYGRAGAATGACRTCGATVDQAERRAWLDEQARDSDLAWTARNIADAYGLNPKTVRAWATDRYSGKTLIRRARLATYWHNGEHLVPWVEPREGEDVKARGDRLHYVADVVDLARETADRREAERERRAERTSA